MHLDNTDVSLSCVLGDIAVSAMDRMWTKRPKGCQISVMIHLLRIRCAGGTTYFVLLVQVTGSGKSTVPQTVEYVFSGVILIIKNTLLLGELYQTYM